jgi:Protein of unknown function (DUF5656)
MNQVLAWLAVQPRTPRTGVAYVAIRVAVYLVALVLMVLVYGTKQRGLIIAPPIALVGGAGTWYLLGDTPLDIRQRLINALGVGVLLAELTWALGYWDVPGAGLVGGASLWLAFYVLSGVVEHAASQNLDRRIALEYALVAIVGTLGILWSAHPWSP